MGTSIYVRCMVFTTGPGLSASILYILNRNTGIWSTTYFINDECDAKDTSVDAFSTSFYLHDSVNFLYSDSILLEV